MGAGPGGVQLFHLVNRVSHRGHRFELVTVGVGLSLPITGSIGSSDYVDFVTPSEVNFFDFEGTNMTVRETNALFYSWTTLSFWGRSVKIADGGLNVPGLGVSHGKCNMLFGDGRLLGPGNLEVKLPPIQPEPGPFRQVAKDDALVYKIPGDVLFAFGKHALIPGQRTDNALIRVGNSLHAVPEYRFLVVGHTDNIGSRAFNRALSKRRAGTVAKWLLAHNYVQPSWLKTHGAGEEEPVASNATPEGRAENRRVEVVALRKKYWDDY
jgi:outer membrane protein OmpA-like peptidoglycan-associated protein